MLLTGETGTGKELAARAIHYHSARRERRFVPVNCGALPADLVESELFGHARGAFTGAAAAKPGLFEEAQGGTLFLDEVGELPLPAQVKLNRALQEKEIRRVGDNQALPVDVRVIAATHRDLREEIACRPLPRGPLLPAARLPGDPAAAARAAGRRAAAGPPLPRRSTPERSGASWPASSRRRWSGSAAYDWPGNVRELENAVERAVAVSAGDRLRAADLPAEVAAAAPAARSTRRRWPRLPYREAVAQARDRISRDYLVALLAEFGGNVTRAAERAGLERESLHRLLRRHGIRSDDFK